MSRLTQAEIRAIQSLIEIGAKAFSAEQPLRDSVKIQGSAVVLSDKLAAAFSEPADSPEPIKEV